MSIKKFAEVVKRKASNYFYHLDSYRTDCFMQDIDDLLLRYETVPCKIGDEVYIIRKYNGTPKIVKGKVSQMYYVGEEMKLAIVVKGFAIGEWGKTVFQTYEDAEKHLKGSDTNG